MSLRDIRVDRYDPSCALCRDQAGRPRAGIHDMAMCNDHALAIGRAALRHPEEPLRAALVAARERLEHVVKVQAFAMTHAEVHMTADVIRTIDAALSASPAAPRKKYIPVSAVQKLIDSFDEAGGMSRRAWDILPKVEALLAEAQEPGKEKV